MLEELEGNDFIQEALQMMPKLEDFRKRLKPKAAQDPFIDKNGFPLEEKIIMG